MGRSKFPGKPTKHVNRKRVNVLCTTFGTTVGDINAVVTVETDNSKKVDAVDSVGIQQTTKVSSESGLKRDKTISKTKRTLVRKRTNVKRTGMLSTVSNKLTGINQVTRRTRSAVTGRRSIRSFSTIRKVSKPKHSLNSTKEPSNLVGKFVLPSRSVHSSRVIKPNKRFIHVEPNEARTFKKCIVNKRLGVQTKESRCKVESDNNVKQCLGDGNNRTLRDSRENSPVRVLHSSGKVVLRQARLQLHTQSATGPEGPFSCSSSNNVSPPGTVTCGVCGAVRFYRFVKQARKFNIYSCESCRKFISKMIKRQSNMNPNNVPVLVCQKGQGMCHVPPIVRSQHWKLFRCAYRARCPACWLKMCLRSFQMPISLKNSLAQLLPKNMQSHDLLFSSPLPLLSWQGSIEKKSELKSEETAQPIRRRPVRFKAVKRDEKPVSPVHTPEIKRQKVDLKGPRVKHVCRSASIVLGQPIATFPGELNKKITDITEEKVADTEKVLNNKDTASTKTIDGSDKIEDLSQANNTNNSSEFKQTSVLKNSMTKSEFSGKKERNSKNVPFSNSSLFENSLLATQKKLREQGKTIAIDFWENYNHDEVCRNGFGLISSEPFSVEAICFLCGSAGKEILLHCLICCEPYHPYCLEQIPYNFTKHNGKYNWLCPRCTTCTACGEAYRQKINCQKCHKAYHPQCFNSSGKHEDKPMVCSNCLRCKNCDSTNITKFIGNLALCLACFKLRNMENVCPVCQKSPNDNDFDAKLMECRKCKKWIHAKCESLTDEQYQILSLLPYSVDYFCKQCSDAASPHWLEIVQNELRSNILNVLRLLAKNRIARNILKLTPYKEFASKAQASAKKINVRDGAASPVESYIVDRDMENWEICRQFNLESQDGGLDSSKYESKLPVLPTMVEIRKRLNSNQYISLHEFNTCMEQAIGKTESEELLNIYRGILKKIFPWYDQALWKENNIANNSLKEANNIYSDLDSIIVSGKENKVDTRTCGFCKGVGDGLAHKESRLLYCGSNEWVHANCAFWSSEIYEEIDGSLQNVHAALNRSKSVKCTLCKQKGASISCCFKGCHESYHFSCAQNTNCYFHHDKTIYCQTHNLENKLNVLTSPSDFHILRSLYVEADRKKKKYSEPDKVHFMVGCLSVTNLGKVVPVISDDFEALIPSGYLCSRLFWSTTEPWKLVRYNISTSTLNSEIGNVQVDRNFTVDHSFPKATVEKQLKEILMWQKEISKDTIDSEFEEEPQNTADILSPELTDAIFEELPHGFLDGISVQDMFMNYEELLNMDFKSEINSNDSMSLNMNSELMKKADDDAEVDLKCYRELKRSKSEVFNQLGNVDKLNKNRSHQRSCSLTWSCKLDNSITPAMKKRKITSRDNMYLQLLQVDGAYDSSSGSDSEGPMNEGDVFLTLESSEEPVSCERCQCTYRTRASYKRHLETCDSFSTSESDSEEESILTSGNLIKTDNPSILVAVTEPSESNLIASYETFSSYQASQNEVHATILNTQTIMSAEATTEVITVPENSNIFPFQQPVEPKTASIPVMPPNITISSVDSLPVRHPSLTISQGHAQLHDPTQTTNTYTINQAQLSANQQPTFCVNQQPLCINQSNTLLNPAGLISLDNSSLALNQTIPISISPITLSQTAPISLNPTVDMQQPVTIQSIPFTSDVTPILSIAPHSQITIDTKMLTNSCPNIVNTVTTQAVNVPQNQWVKPVVKPTMLSHKTIRPRGRPRSLVAKRSRMHTGSTIVMSQPNSVGPSVIVQHLPSANMMPAFVDAFQQQTGQNLQYVATITPQMTPQTQLVQLQPNNNILSLVPGVQPTMIIQQPRVITDQLIVDGNGSMMWTTQPVQPVYYGFETIVQNTVMQSQQFLPSTMPGVLTTNSSYSATTQVFQTSKLEPVLDVPTGSFVLLNSGQLVNPQTIQIPPQLPQTISQNVPSPSQLPITNVNHSHNKTKWEPIEPMTMGEILTQPKPPAPPASTVSNNMHSISLPLAPFVSEQGIPTNIVTPTPKPPASTQTRPMSRVLPMQTNACRELKKAIEEKIIGEKEVDPCEKDNLTTTLAKINILENISLKPSEEIIFDKQDHLPEEITKPDINQQKLLSIQKQKQEWKADNTSNTSKVISPVQIAPLKPIKPTISEALEEKIELKIPEICPPYDVKQEILETETKLIQQEKIKSKNTPSILYTVETHEGFRYTSTSIYELWSKVFEAVQGARAAHSMAPLPANALDTINNLQLLGLKTNGLRYLLEQLPGASKCTKYKPTYHVQSAQDDSDDDIDLNSSYGAIRSIPYVRKKEPTDMFGWLASKHRKPENSLIDSDLLPRRGGSITNLPMAMRFRQLKLTSKFSVGVYRSGIHRRGLFSLRDIESGEMVIEYAGEVIRSVLTDKREKYYNSKGIGCYMFRIDDNLVVDATMKGNAARFINHSCDPNCYSKVVEIHGHKHIIIFALRRILCGEELTYDYKFPFEEDKIPCTCGARRCRKFLN